MRIVVALGGNALLRRGQRMTTENQHDNVRLACDHLAPLAACDFATATGHSAVIGALRDIGAMVDGSAGTRIATDVDGLLFAPSVGSRE